MKITLLSMVLVLAATACTDADKEKETGKFVRLYADCAVRSL